MDKSDLNELKNMLSGLEASIMAKVDEKLDKITTKSEQKTEKKQKYRRRQQKEKKTTNGFNVDDLGLTSAERKELAQASKSDRQNNVHVQRERLTQRRPSGRIEVRCRSCGKTEKVSPALVIKDEDGFRYKCNKCSCSPG
jgi:hypothetical protein